MAKGGYMKLTGEDAIYWALGRVAVSETGSTINNLMREATKNGTTLLVFVVETNPDEAYCVQDTDGDNVVEWVNGGPDGE